MSGDRRDIHDRALAEMKRPGEAARQLQRREEIELVDLAPGGDIAVEAAQALFE